MPILQQYLFAIGAFQGLLLAMLLIPGSGNSHANRILGVWCLFLALSFAGAFITMDGQINAFSGLIGWSLLLPAGYGSLLYLYCRHAITDRPFAPADLLHFAPMLLCYLLNIDLLLASPEVKLDLVVAHPPQSLRFQASQLILYLQAFVYLAMSVILLRRCQHQAERTLSSFNPAIFRWLWKLLGLYLAIWCMKALAELPGNFSFFSRIGDGLIVVLIYSIAMAQWRNPRLFKIEQLIPEPDELDAFRRTATPDANAEPADRAPSQSVGALDASIRSSLLQAVRQHMHEQQSYLDNQLTLTRLAEAVGVSTHHLSEVLNLQEGKNFYQFVNQYRVDFVRERMQADRSAKILDLAMAAGFASKSTFNAVFKQFTGLTPSQYREQLAAE